MKKIVFTLVAMATMTTSAVNAQSKQTTDFGLGTIYVNENVTTHLLMPETIRLVDISTDTIVGNQVNDNIVRLKPKCGMSDYDEAGIVTVIGERHIAQYRLVYRTCTTPAVTRFTVPFQFLNVDDDALRGHSRGVLLQGSQSVGGVIHLAASIVGTRHQQDRHQ